ncbi:MAG: terpene cyclase/mutase family protein [Bacteroidales bacterium]|nr:terpene cyclase/mutase family protein [Bacteroidales bacterium]
MGRFPLLTLLTLLGGYMLCLPTPAAPVPADTIKIDERTKRSINKSLEWLKDRQRKDGSWGNTAITSFALLAYMANGHVPNRGLFGPEVGKGVRYLLAAAQESGYLVHPSSGGNMYCHGMATLALTQFWGMTGDEEIKKVLKKAVELIVKTQNHEGGWRYEPAPTGADISVTIMMVMALRGAKDSGLYVPDETMKKAIDYIDRCHDSKSGGYKYQPYSHGPGYARTAAGVCVLQLCGDYEAKEIDRAVQYLEKEGDDRQHYWYGHYYAAHAFHQIGGKAWEEYYTRLKTKLLATQRSSGEWHERMEGHVGPEYQTAIAVLILAVPSHYLPIYQR